MSDEINKAILAKRTDEGKVERIHPETTADQVKYTNEKTVKQRLDELHDTNDNFESRFEANMLKFAAIDAKFEEQDTTIDEINNILDATEQDIADKIAEVKQNIADAEQELRDDIIAVDEAATAERNRIEGVLNTANLAIESAKSDIIQVEEAIATHTANIATIRQDISDLEYDIETDITNIRNSLNETKELITTEMTEKINTDISALEDKIAQYKSSMDTMRETIEETEQAIDDRVTAARQSISNLESEVNTFKTSVSTTYATKKEREDGDALVMTKLTTEYTNTEDLAKTYATQSLVSQTSEEILNEVSQNYVDNATGDTYATKAALKITADKLDLEASKIATVTEDLADYKETNDEAVDNVLTKLTTEYTATADFSVAPDQIASTVQEAINTTKTYADGKVAQEVIDRNSAITQSASAIETMVAETYVTSEAAENTYATQTSLKQTSDKLEVEAAKIVTVTEDLADYKETNDEAVEGVLNKLTTEYTATADFSVAPDQIASTVSESLNTAKTYADGKVAQEVLDRNSAITQSASEILQTVSETYLNSEDAATTYATQTALSQTADAIELEASKNYATKTELNDYKDTVTSTYETKADFKLETDAIKSSVSETYTNATEYADGKVAQEVLDRNSAITQSASEILQTVEETYVSSDDAADTYATKTALSQTADAIELSASQTYSTKTELNTYKNSNDAAISALQSATDTNAQDLAAYILSNTQDLAAIQAQVDGSIMTWFYDYPPSDNTEPTSDWTTDALKNTHLGDLFYDTDSGYCYRYSLENDDYSWVRVSDTDVTRALEAASKAQDTADSKRRVFVNTPTPPYDIGDMWLQGSNGDIMRCRTAKTESQSYDATDWVVASKYTDDSAVTALATTVAETYETKADFLVAKDAIESSVSETYTRATQYTDGQITTEVTNRNSAITQKSNEILQTVSETYVSSDDAAATYATQTALDQTKDAIELSASQTYTKTTDFNSYKTTNNAAVAAAEQNAKDYADDKIDDALDSVSETYETKADFLVAKDAIESSVSENLTTAKNYADGKVAQEVTDRNSAITQKADQILQTVSETYINSEDAATTYATQTALNQTKDTIELAASQTYTKTTDFNSYKTTNDAAVADATAYATKLYGVSSTATGTNAKTATCDGFKLFTGATVTVKFTNGNSVTGATTLNINNTGAKPIAYQGATNKTPTFAANTTATFTYDGTYWRLVGDGQWKAAADAQSSADSVLTKLTTEYTATSDFSVAPSEIASTVSEAVNTSKEYADGKIAQEVVDRNAAITQKAGEIELAASNTYTTKTEFNDLEIGGRNLIALSQMNTNDGDFINTNGVITDKTPTSDPRGWTDQSTAQHVVTLSPGKYILSIYIDRATNESTAGYYVYNASASSAINGRPVNNTSKFDTIGVKYTKFTITEESTIFIVIKIYDGAYRIKLEKGDKPTDWTPAPEDTTADITSVRSSIDILSNQITSEVTAREEVDQALSELTTRVTQNSTDITTEIAARQAEINKVSEIIIGTQTAATSSWTGKSNTLTELKDGTTINYWLPYAGAADVTLNLTLADNTTTGAINCYYGGTTRLSTHYSAGNMIRMTYRVNANVNGNNYTGWWADGQYNTNNYDRTLWNNSIPTAGILKRYSIIGGTASGFKTLASGIEINLEYPILYLNSSSDVAANATTGAGYIAMPSVNLTYTKSNFSGIVGKQVYVYGTLNGNTLTIDENIFTCTVPTTEDGKVYIPIGILANTTTCYFNSTGNIPYAYKDGKFAPVAGNAQRMVDNEIEARSTIIREFAGGVLIAKVGQTIAALVNANGSFDVVGVTWNGKTPTVTDTLYARYGTATIIKNSSGDYIQLSNGNITVSGTITGATIQGGSLTGTTVTGSTIQGNTIKGGTLDIGSTDKYIKWDGSNLSIKSDSLTIAGVNAATTTNVATAKSEAISAAASDATTKANAAQSAAQTYADTAVSNLEIGGRNLLTKEFIKPSNWTNLIRACTTFTGDGYTNTWTMVETGGFEHVYILVPVEAGQAYTLSLNFKVNKAFELWNVSRPFTFQILKGDSTFNTTSDSYNNVIASIPIGNTITTDTRKSVTFTPSTNSVYFNIPGGYVKDGSTDISINFDYFKLEKGTKATDWTPAPEDTINAINESNTNIGQLTEIILGTQTSATGSWTGKSNYIYELTDGLSINYWLPYAGSGSATLNLTLADGTTTGAINCYYGGTTRLGTHYAAGNIIRLIYRKNANINGASYTGWWADANYDSNYYDRTWYNGSVTAGEAVAAGGCILVGTAAGTFITLKADTAFDITKPILYTSSAINSGAVSTSTYLVLPGIDLTKIKSGFSGTNHAMVYIVGTLSGTMFTPNSTLITTTVPTSESTLHYMLLGQMTSTTVFTLLSTHDIYKYHNGAFKSIIQIALEAASSASDANAAASAAQSTANANIKAVVTLFYLSNSTTAPSKPSAHVTSTSTGTGVWTTAVPTWTSTYKYFYTCNEYQYGNGTYGWSAVVYDRERSEAMNTKYTLDGLSRIENGKVLIDGGNIYINDTFTNNLFAKDITATGTIRGVNLIGSDISGGTMRIGNETKYIEWDGSNLTIKSDNLDIGGKPAATTTDVTNAQNAAQSYTDNAVNNLEIGGRNYLRNTGTYNNYYASTASYVSFPNDENDVYLRFTNPTAGGWPTITFAPFIPADKIAGKTITVSCYVRCINPPATGADTDIHLTLNAYNSDGNVNRVGTKAHSFNSSVLASKDWVRLSYQLDVDYSNWYVESGHNIDEFKYITLCIYNHIAAAIDFKLAKLEIGSKATDWSPAPEDVDASISNLTNITDQASEIIYGTQTTATATWTGKSEYLTELKNGTSILYWLPYAGASNVTLNLTLADGTTTGAKNCYYSGTTRLSTHYAAGNIIRLTYLINASVDGTNYTGWWSDANYNTNTYDRTQFSGAIKAGSTAIAAGNIIVAGANNAGTYTHLKLGNAFDITYPILYATAAIAAGATGASNYITIPFTVTTTQNITLTAYKPVYIQGKLSGSNFTPVSTTPLTQTLPTSDNGYQYIYLGSAYSTTTIYLTQDHPVYQYYNGAFKTTTQIAVEAATAAYNNAQDLANYITSNDAALEEIQRQVDGSITTWFYAAVPTASNEPAKNWNTTELKNTHLGDLYYDTSTGHCYRYQLSGSTYSWSIITDSDVSKALADAAKAQDTADNKRRVFVTTPVVPYDVGDLWVGGSTGDIKKCKTAKTSSQSYAAADWELASKYTDDTTANTAVNYATKLYVDCATAAGTAAKVGTCSGFVLFTGATITVRFQNGNTVTGATTLNVNNTGAKPIVYLSSGSMTPTFGTYTNVSFVYDGTYWRLVGDASWKAATDAQSTANANIKIATPLYYLSNSTTAPGKPTAHVTSTSTGTGVWTTVIPVWTSTYKYFYTCTEYQNGAGTYSWSAVVYDRERSESMESKYTLDGLKKIDGNKVLIDGSKIYVDEAFANSIFAQNITATGTISGATINGAAITGGTMKIGSDSKYIEWNGSNLVIKSDTLQIGGVDAATTTDVTDAVDNLEIGGCNLLLKTADLSINPWKKESGITIEYDSTKGMYKITYSGSATSRFGIYQDLTLEPSQTYTLSCNMAGINAGLGWNFQTSISGFPTARKVLTSADKIRYSISLDSTDTAYKCRIYLYIYLANGTKEAWFSYPKLEKGNKATDWTPAPEDVTNYTDTLVNNIQIGGRNLLLDTDVNTLNATYNAYSRYLSVSGNTAITGIFVELTDPPISNIKYAYQITADGTQTATQHRGLCFYNGAGVKMRDGETYTVSCWARKISGTTALDSNGNCFFQYGVSIYVTNGDDNIIITNPLTTNWQRYSWTFTYDRSRADPNATYASGGARIYFYGCHFAANTAGSFQMCGFQLENGNVLTDYSPAPEEAEIAANQSTEVIQGTQTGTTGTWTGVSKYINSLRDGLTINYWLPYAGSGNATLNLTLAGGGTTGAKNCYYNGTGRLTTHYGAGNLIRLTYRENVNIAGTNYTGWWSDANYYVDTIENRIPYFAGKTGAKGIWANSLFMKDSAGTYQNICTASDGTVTSSNRTTDTTKKANTNGFEVGSPIWYCNTTYAANTNITGNGNVYSSTSAIDSRYSLNTTLTAGSLTAYKPVYLVGTIKTDGLFYLDTTWWTQTPTNTSKVYVMIGSCYDSSTSYCRIVLLETNGWYKYVGNKLVDYSNNLAALAQATADSAVTKADAAQSTANTANNTARANIKIATPLWYLSSSSTAPNKPTAHITQTGDVANAWTTAVPTYSATNKYFYTCTEYQNGAGTYSWSNVVYDRSKSTLAGLSKIESGKVLIDGGNIYVNDTFTSNLFANDITLTHALMSNNYNGTTSAPINNTAGTIFKMDNGTLNIGGGKIKWDGTNLSIVANSVTIGGTTAATTANVTAAQNAANTANNRATYKYGTCTTAAATAAKVVTLSGFALYTGAQISVKFTYANTVANPTLNVNSTGAKAIYAYGAAIRYPYYWNNNATVSFVYDGTNWILDDSGALSAADIAASQGLSLVVNGNGVFKNNSNFSSWTYDGTASTNGSYGSFTRTAKADVFSDGYFKIDPNKCYQFEFDAKTSNGLSTLYSALAFYDVDKNHIANLAVMYLANTTTTLAKDLKNGDTVVYLTDLTNWNVNTGTATYKRGFIFWNYTNSVGYTYPEHTYSQNVFNNVYAADSSVNKTAKTITLSAAWNHGTFAKGTKVSQSSSGNAYSYVGVVGTVVPNTWTRYSGIFYGVDTSGNNANGKIRYGAAYARVVFLWNNNNANDQTWVTNIAVYEVDNALMGMSRIESGKILVEGGNIYVNDAFANRVFAQNITATGSITSPVLKTSNYNGTNNAITNTTGSIINMNAGTMNIGGKLKFDGSTLTIDGNVTATSGSIGGFTLGTTKLYTNASQTATSTNQAGVYIGTDGINISNGTAATTTYITKTAINIGGKLTWNGTTLSVNGTVTASAGTIGGFTLSTNKLYTNSSQTKNSTTQSGVYLGTDGINISGGTAAKTVYINTDGNMNIGGKLVWNGTNLTIAAQSVTIGGTSAATTTNVTDAVNNIEIGGRNLYIVAQQTNGYVDGTTGTINAMSSTYKCRTSHYIPVTAGEHYIWQAWVPGLPTSQQMWIGYFFYSDTNGTAVGTRTAKYGTATTVKYLMYEITVPANATYMRVSYRQFEDGYCKLEKGNKATDWSLSPEDANKYTDNAVNNIEIGGRNLLLNTLDLSNHYCGPSNSGGTWTFTDNGNVATLTATAKGWPVIHLSGTASIPYATNMDLLGNSTIITSAEIKFSSGSAGNVYILPIIYNSGRSRIWFPSTSSNFRWTTLPTTWTKFVTGALSADYTTWGEHDTNTNQTVAGFGALIYWYGTGTIYIRNPKMEVGNKATNWTPAPEDTNAAIDRIKGFFQLTSSYSTTMADLTSWSIEGKDAGNWDVTSTAGVAVGDTVAIKCTATDNNTTVYCLVTVTSIPSATIVKGISHGMIDVSARSSAISTAAGDATSKANAALASAKNYADTGIKNLKIGGTNLLLDSKKGAGTSSTAYAIGDFNFSEALVSGETYTVSAYVTTTNRTSVGFYHSGGSYSMVDSGDTTWISVTSNGIYTKTFTATANMASQTSGVGYGYCRVYSQPSSGGGAASVKWIKIEKGSKATEWSPAPKDIIASSTILYYLGPSGFSTKPTAHVTSVAQTATTWTTKMPLMTNAISPNLYFYRCTEYLHGDGSYSWSDIVRDENATALAGISKIQNGKVLIDGGNIYVTNAFAKSVFAENVTATGTITSPILKTSNYNGTSNGINNTAGSIINMNAGTLNIGAGKLKFDGSTLTINGNVTATSGSIAGFTLASSKLYTNTNQKANSTDQAGVYIGTDGINISNGTAATTTYIGKGSVNIGDSLKYNTTNGLELNGNLTATNGTITGVTLNGAKITGNAINISSENSFIGKTIKGTYGQLIDTLNTNAYSGIRLLHYRDIKEREGSNSIEYNESGLELISPKYNTSTDQLYTTQSHLRLMYVDENNHATITLGQNGIGGTNGICLACWNSNTNTYDKPVIVRCGLESSQTYTTFTDSVVSSGTIRVIKKLGWCQVFGVFTISSTAPSSWTEILNISQVPAPQYRYAQYTTPINWASSYKRPIRIRIAGSGGLAIIYGAANTEYNFSITYPIE